MKPLNLNIILQLNCIKFIRGSEVQFVVFNFIIDQLEKLQQCLMPPFTDVQLLVGSRRRISQQYTAGGFLRTLHSASLQSVVPSL